MAKHQIQQLYQTIEGERKQLKEQWCHLKNNKGDKEEIKRIGTALTKLTLKQVHLLIDLEFLE